MKWHYLRWRGPVHFLVHMRLPLYFIHRMKNYEKTKRATKILGLAHIRELLRFLFFLLVYVFIVLCLVFTLFSFDASTHIHIYTLYIYYKPWVLIVIIKAVNTSFFLWDLLGFEWDSVCNIFFFIIVSFFLWFSFDMSMISCQWIARTQIKRTNFSIWFRLSMYGEWWMCATHADITIYMRKVPAVNC